MKKTFRQHCSQISVKTEPFKAKDKRNRGKEKLRQLFVTASSKMNPFSLHHYFTKSSLTFKSFSLKSCQYYVNKMLVVLSDSFLFPYIADCKRKVLIQFDILSSCLYVVVLKSL